MRMPRETKPKPDGRAGNGHYNLENFRERMTTAEWKAILLGNNDSIVYKGELRRLVAKKLGYGVVEVYKAPLES